MPVTLESLSHPVLGKATENMYQIATAYLGRFFAARFYDELEATWFVTDPLIKFNKVVRTPFTTDTPKDIIDATLTQIAATSDGSMSWDVGPSIRSARLEECLHTNGWSKVGEVRSMVLDLRTLEAHMERPDGLTIKTVDDEKTFKQHVDTMIIGFEFPEPIAHHLSNITYGNQFLNDPVVRYYVGYIDEQPVTISLSLLHEGIAGIYNVATIPQMRRQGFGAAMTLTALHEARDLGYHVAVLQASKLGASMYRQMGFQDHFMFDSYRFQRETER
ncbi:hypothetical protein KSD_73760 [Ktedonobacter sp. SOSP1-85]|uniref:GNAT family N-acetyltransferase n=1 Tax=Ktedonobacter sp. SOSP1-85 TaxID=2778367 RepID=UPI001914E6C0|nr:GNAT family N-acetyltransferase [Ktedonobacter sp. SOSP1-85]GHO79605.1 hypothetical protein KSD_73760 [Ktedonobacter sp. SOSP1-85]